MRTLAPAVCLAALAASAAAGVRAQQTTPVLRASADYVEVDAVVTDAHGAFVRGLTKDDFEIKDAGVVRPIGAFAAVDLPVPASAIDDDAAHGAAAAPAAPRPPAPDVASNAHAASGRLYVLAVDHLHLEPRYDGRIKQLLAEFVDRDLGPDDLAAVVHIGYTARGQGFTADRSLLLAQAGVAGAKSDSAAMTANDTDLAIEHDRADAVVTGANDDLMARVDKAERMLAAVAATSHYLSGVTGRRKALVVFTEGIDVDVNVPVDANERAEEAAERVSAAERDALAAAARDNVSIYTIDPRGLPVVDMLQAQPGASTTAGVMAEFRNESDSLHLIADSTGGAAFAASNNFTHAFSRIVADSSAYYVLGYAAPPIKADGQFHGISVTVKRPGVHVLARNGYYATKAAAAPAASPAPGPRDALSALLSSPAPMIDDGLGVRMTAATVGRAGAASVVAIAVEVNAAGLSFAEPGGPFTGGVDVAYTATDANGKIQAQRKDNVALRLQPATRASIGAHGWRYVTEIAVPPGAYQIRAAVRDQTSGHAGAAGYDVTVPDFGKPTLSIGEVAISSALAGATPTAGTSPVLTAALHAPMTAARDFPASAPLGVFARIANHGAAPGHQITVAVVVRDASGREALRQPRTGDAAALEAAGGAFTAVVSLNDLADGAYTLAVDVKTDDGRAVSSRAVPFRIAR